MEKTKLKFFSIFAFFCVLSLGIGTLPVVAAPKITAPTITVSSATNVLSATATINGRVTATGGENPVVIMYFGKTDGGQLPEKWDKNYDMGSQGTTAFFKNLADLIPGTKYYFSARATNSIGTSWPKASVSFTTKAALSTVKISVATDVTTTTATLNGEVLSTGGANPAVTLYWGAADEAGQVPAKWAKSAALPAQGAAFFLKNITGLTPGTKYYFTAKAVNAAGTAWPAEPLSFTTLVALPVISISAATNVVSAFPIVLDKVNIGDTGSESTHSMSGWSIANIPGGYGGKDDGTYRQVVEGAQCNDSGRDASFVLNAGTGAANTLKLRHLNGISNSDGFEVYVNDTLLGKYATVQTKKEYWVTDDYALNNLTGNLVVRIHATDALWAQCSKYGQVAFSWAEISAVTRGTLNGKVASVGGEKPSVTMYFGTTDGGKVPEKWDRYFDLGAQGVATFSKNVTDLNPGTKYFFTAKATNSAGTVWPKTSLSFTTKSVLPAINIKAASDLTTTTVVLGGDVTATGGANPTVTFYWGTTDGGQNSKNWAKGSAPTSPTQPQGIASFSKNVTGLTPGTKYYFAAKATNTAGTSWSTPSLSFTTQVAFPALTISAATNVKSDIATLNGKITVTGGQNPVTTFYWGTTDGGQVADKWDKSLTIADSDQPQGVSAFLQNVTGLNPGTKYYFTAKATNSAGTAWAKASLSFTTLAPSTVALASATKITTATATINGKISSTGGDNPSVIMYWGKTDGGQVAENWDFSSIPTSPAQPQKAASFLKDIAGLDPSTKYYFTAKATNSIGDGWPKASLSFTTSALAIPTVAINAANNVVSTSATINGSIVAIGKAKPSVTIYWGTTDGGQVANNWEHNSTPTSPTQPQAAASFLKNLIGLNPGTKYYFTAKATNSSGDAWPKVSLSFTTLSSPTVILGNVTNVTSLGATLGGEITATGGVNPTVIMYWGTTDGDQVPGKWDHSFAPTSPTQPQGVDSFYEDVTDLKPDTKYYFSASATNSVGTSWPEASASFTTPALAASKITISAVTHLTSSSATLNGSIASVSGGNPTVTMYWGTTDGGQTPENWDYRFAPTTPLQPQGVGDFSKDVTNLIAGTKYYFTAKATNLAGDSWPAESLDFTPTSDKAGGTEVATYVLTITPNNGIAMGSSFSSTYNVGSIVTFTAIPTIGYVFDHWSGDMTGDVNPINITMDGDKSIIANFVPATPSLNINLGDAAASFLSRAWIFVKNVFTFDF